MPAISLNLNAGLPFCIYCLPLLLYFVNKSSFSLSHLADPPLATETVENGYGKSTRDFLQSLEEQPPLQDGEVLHWRENTSSAWVYSKKSSKFNFYDVYPHAFNDIIPSLPLVRTYSIPDNPKLRAFLQQFATGDFEVLRVTSYAANWEARMVRPDRIIKVSMQSRRSLRCPF
jgi:hypothetical protein